MPFDNFLNLKQTFFKLIFDVLNNGHNKFYVFLMDSLQFDHVGYNVRGI